MQSQLRSTNATGGLIAGFTAGGISVGLFLLSEHWPLLAHLDDLVFFYSPGIIFGITISVYCWPFVLADHSLEVLVSSLSARALDLPSAFVHVRIRQFVSTPSPV
jgi:hypothetical protein